MSSKVFLIPTVLHEDAAGLSVLPNYIVDAVKSCTSFFVENEKIARRFLKRIWKDIVIDDYYWRSIQKVEDGVLADFTQRIRAGETIGIISDAGCPGVADPGQILVAKAQEMQVKVVPLVGPSSILLALMASGMNGQHFEFIGYLPIEQSARKKAIKEIEAISMRKKSTIIFIETPYRNNVLISDLLTACCNSTRLCIAVNITSASEYIRTQTIAEWKRNPIDIHKQPAIFLLAAT